MVMKMMMIMIMIVIMIVIIIMIMIPIVIIIIVIIYFNEGTQLSMAVFRANYVLLPLYMYLECGKGMKSSLQHHLL